MAELRSKERYLSLETLNGQETCGLFPQKMGSYNSNWQLDEIFVRHYHQKMDETLDCLKTVYYLENPKAKFLNSSIHNGRFKINSVSLFYCLKRKVLLGNDVYNNLYPYVKLFPPSLTETTGSIYKCHTPI